MRGKNMKVETWAIILMFVGLALFGVQALVWRSGTRGTQTDTENRAGHPVTEAPVLAGTVLLLLAGTILVIPRDEN